MKITSMVFRRFNFISIAATLALVVSLYHAILSVRVFESSIYFVDKEILSQHFIEPTVLVGERYMVNDIRRLEKKRSHWGVTFLFGIPTVANPKEAMRRQMIRETYLSFYKTFNKSSDRICKLTHILNGNTSLQDCQIAYAFFMGANKAGPPELLSPNATFPMTRDRPKLDPAKLYTIGKGEDDIIYLNIRENQFDGKMPTWFKYGSMVVEEMNVPFDYIAKVDSDTLLFIPTLLEFADVHLRDTSKLIHVGLPFFSNFCNKKKFDDHPCPMPLAGDLYMSGEFSAMSSQLASIITSPAKGMGQG